MNSFTEIYHTQIEGEDLGNFMSMLGYHGKRNVTSNDDRYHLYGDDEDNLFEFPTKLTRYGLLKAHKNHVMNIGIARGKKEKEDEIKAALGI